MFSDLKTAFQKHERLKAELRIRGTSLAKISRDLGISGTSMSLVGLASTAPNALSAHWPRLWGPHLSCFIRIVTQGRMHDLIL